MRRPVWSRAVAALFALWLTVYTVEPAALNACDVHDAPRAASNVHDMNAGHPAATIDDAQPSGENSCCTCRGACALTSPPALPALSSIPVVVFTTATVDTGLPDYAYTPVAAAHVLPFANGPPARA